MKKSSLIKLNVDALTQKKSLSLFVVFVVVIMGIYVLAGFECKLLWVIF